MQFIFYAWLKTTNGVVAFCLCSMLFLLLCFWKSEKHRPQNIIPRRVRVFVSSPISHVFSCNFKTDFSGTWPRAENYKWLQISSAKNKNIHFGCLYACVRPRKISQILSQFFNFNSWRRAKKARKKKEIGNLSCITKRYFIHILGKNQSITKPLFQSQLNVIAQAEIVQVVLSSLTLPIKIKIKTTAPLKKLSISEKEAKYFLFEKNGERERRTVAKNKQLERELATNFCVSPFEKQTIRKL